MISVLVIDSSSFIRDTIAAMLGADKEIKAIQAKDYAEAIRILKEKKPDVVVLNAEMPGISGYDILYSIMQIRPTPSILISPDSELGMKEAINAFKYGVVDFLPLPETKNINIIKDELIVLVKVASSVDLSKLIPPKAPALIKAPARSEKLILIGASSGGPPAIEYLLSSLPSSFPSPILVVQHMPPNFTKTFADRLDRICKIRVREAKDGDILEKGTALVAPGGFNLKIARQNNSFVVQLSNEPARILPNIDIAFRSAAIAGDRIVAILLTGMGDDGAEGAEEIKNRGGCVIVQDKKTSVIFGMPNSIIKKGCADFVLPLQDISKKINELL
jgi:two-component system chemotaxis response regulator CheB